MRCVTLLFIAVAIVALCPSSEGCGGRRGRGRVGIRFGGHRRPSHGHHRPHHRPSCGHHHHKPKPKPIHIHRPGCGHHHVKPRPPIHIHKPGCGHHHHKPRPPHHHKPGCGHHIGGIIGGIFGGIKPHVKPPHVKPHRPGGIHVGLPGFGINIGGRPHPRPTPSTCIRPPRPPPPPPSPPPPPIVVTLTIISVSHINPGTIFGGSQTLSCKVNRHAGVVYSIYHNGRRVQHGSDHEYVMESIDNSDAGNYQCRVTIKGKHYDSKIIVVVVKAPVTTTLTPQNPSAITGESQTLVCHTTHMARIAHSFAFYHNGRKVQSGRHNKLVLKHLTPRNAGNYQCRVTAGGDTFDSNIFHLVIEVITVHPPTLTPTNPSPHMPAGLDQILTCISPDSGDLLYTFTKDGKVVQNGRDERLVLRDISPADSGAYACFVTKGGYDSIVSQVYTLTVQVTIERPTMSCSCSSSHVWIESSLTLTCGAVHAHAIYHFYKDGDELRSDHSNVFTISSISSHDAGVYTCTMEMHGQPSDMSNQFPIQVMEKCNSPIDLLFLVDKSASIKPHQFKISKQFMQKMIAKFDVSPDVVRVGTVLFANGPHNGFCFDKYTSGSSLHDAIGSLSCPKCKRGKTATGAALQYARENSLTSHCGARASVKKIVVVLTDGRSTEAKSYVSNQAEAMKLVADEVITIGVGKIRKSELEMIATKDEYVFTTNDFSKLEGMLDDIATRTCEAGAAGSDFDYQGGDDWSYDEEGFDSDWDDSDELDWEFERK